MESGMSVIQKQRDSLAQSYVSTLFQFDEVVVRGPDAVQFISNFTTADIYGLQEHEGCDGFFCDARGWVLEVAVLFRSDDGLLIRVARGRGHGLAAHLDRYHIREELSISEAQEELHSVLMSGSQIKIWLEEYFDISVPAKRYQQLQARDDNNPFSTQLTSVKLMPVDWLSSDGFLMIVPGERKDILQASLLAAGLQNSADEMITYLRLQQGWPSVNDIPEKTLPQEVGLNDRTISLTKGCYLGQETVARLDALGHVNRRLVVLAVERGESAVVGDNVASNNEVVSQVTSVGCLGKQEATLAMAIIPLKSMQQEANLTVGGKAANVVSTVLLETLMT
jgi:folate-binding protein YgfZ